MPTLEDLTVDQLLATAKQFQASHTLLETLAKNPETRTEIQRAIKKVNPNIVIPEIDASDRVLAKVDEERKAREKLEGEIREKDIRERIEHQRAKAMSDYKLTDADMVEVEKLMLDKDYPISTYDAAARVFLASKRPAVPTFTGPELHSFQMPEKDLWGPGIGNPAKLNKIAMDEAYRAFDDIKSGKVAGMGGAV